MEHLLSVCAAGHRPVNRLIRNGVTQVIHQPNLESGRSQAIVLHPIFLFLYGIQLVVGPKVQHNSSQRLHTQQAKKDGRQPPGVVLRGGSTQDTPPLRTRLWIAHPPGSWLFVQTAPPPLCFKTTPTWPWPLSSPDEGGLSQSAPCVFYNRQDSCVFSLAAQGAYGAVSCTSAGGRGRRVPSSARLSSASGLRDEASSSNPWRRRLDEGVCPIPMPSRKKSSAPAFSTASKSLFLSRGSLHRLLRGQHSKYPVA